MPRIDTDNLTTCPVCKGVYSEIQVGHEVSAYWLKDTNESVTACVDCIGDFETASGVDIDSDTLDPETFEALKKHLESEAA